MRVLFSLLDAAIGGGQRVALEAARQLVAEGNKIGVFVPGQGPASEEFRAMGAELYRADLQALGQIRGVGPAAEIARGYDLLYSHTSVPGEILGARVARHAHIPHVVHRHSIPHFSPRTVTRFVQERLYQRELHTTPFIAVASHVATSLERHGIERRRISVVPNGVDIEVIRQRGRQSGLRAKRPAVGALGRFDPSRGLDVFAKAARQVGELTATLVIGGVSGPFVEHEQAVRRIAAKASVDVEDPASAGVEFLASLDIVVLPSRYEGSPITLFEAMALGKPIIASRIPGIAEVLEPEGAGVLVAPQDAEELAGAITSLVEDPTRCKALGRTALEVVRREHDIGTQLARVTRILHSAVGTRTVSRHPPGVASDDSAVYE